MISYEELDRALARWKARKSGVGAADLPPMPIDGEATPLPIRAEELGSIPNEVSPIPGERTGEIDANELVESYDEAE
jgi:hypothetical protein